jgi:hypothetical protein
LASPAAPAGLPPTGAIDNRRMYLFLLALTVASAVGLQGWFTLINNFAVEVAGLDGFQMGVVQGVREVPGFLALLVIYLLFLFTEHRLAALSVLVLGLGVALTGFLPTFMGITFTALVMSFGFHYFETLNQSLTLQYFDLEAAPVVAGRLRGFGAAATLGVGAAVFVMAEFLSFTAMFAIIGAAVALVGAACLLVDPSDKEMAPQRKRMILRRRYWLYYALTFFAGARRQIFMAFAVFLLVQKFSFSVQTVTALFLVNNLAAWFVGMRIGRAINRFGERAVLSVEYLSLIAIFVGYAFSGSGVVVAVLYVLDHVVFTFAIAIRTYFQKIGDRADIAPTMAVGFTINHIAAVALPVLGGVLWVVDYRLVFLGGAGLALCSLLLVQAMGRRGQATGAES